MLQKKVLWVVYTFLQKLSYFNFYNNLEENCVADINIETFECSIFLDKEETGCVKEKCGDDRFVYDDNHPFVDIVITFSLAQCEWNLPWENTGKKYFVTKSVCLFGCFINENILFA